MEDKKYKFACCVCGKEKSTNQRNQLICSKQCREDFHGRKNRVGNKYNIPTGTTGAISEIAVAKYLMLNGYSVFHAMSPASFCDLIAIKNDDCMYVEARTGYKDLLGKLYFPHNISNKNGLPTHYAVYVVDKDTVDIIKISDEDYKKYVK